MGIWWAPAGCHGQKDFCDPTNSPDFEKKLKHLKSPDYFFTTVTEVAKIIKGSLIFFFSIFSSGL
jgi:hypothetical protein